MAVCGGGGAMVVATVHPLPAPPPPRTDLLEALLQRRDPNVGDERGGVGGGVRW